MNTLRVYGKLAMTYLGTHVSCSTREYGTYAGSCKSNYHCSDGVGNDSYDIQGLAIHDKFDRPSLTCDSISNHQSVHAHCGCHLAHHLSQLAEGIMLYDPELIARSARDTVIVSVEKILCVVEACTGKPFWNLFVFALLDYLQ